MTTRFGVLQRSLLAEAFHLLRAARTVEARAKAEALAKAWPGNPEVEYLLAEVAAAEGDGPRAIVHLEAVTHAVPGQWVPLVKLARLLLGQRRREAFRSVASQAAQAAGENPEALFSVARAYLAADQPGDAIPLLRLALASPQGKNEPQVWQELATALFFLGAAEQAEFCIPKALELAPCLPAALHLRSMLRRQSSTAHHVDDLRARLAMTSDDEAHTAIHFALAKELEDIGEHEAAFIELQRGSSIRASRVSGGLVDEIGTMARIAEHHHALALARMGSGDPSDGPIFIIGMPRSGTTLLERMLGRLPGVAAAGELLDLSLVIGDAARRVQNQRPDLDPVHAVLEADAAAIGAEYLRGAREAVPGSPFWVDKTPVNFLYAGLVHQCLPQARMLHLTRAPMDACFAVYKTLFGQAYPFSYQLDTLADYYIAYRRLMAHWHREFPGAILDVPYEALVTRTRETSERVLAFCGFAWDEVVLQPELNLGASSTASAAQVREPIHARSIGAWRRHTVALEPLRQRLEDAGLVDSAGEPC